MLRRLAAVPAVLLAVLLFACAFALAACGGGSLRSTTKTVTAPVIGQTGNQPQASQQLGFPGFATKNTTRVGGADAIADAAAVARAVYPGGAPNTTPPAVVLADQGDWQSSLAASVLMSSPLRAPTLLTDGSSIPKASSDALAALAPTGVSSLNGAQAIRIGDAPAPPGMRSTDIAGKDPYSLAAAIDRFSSTASGTVSRDVVVVSGQDPAFAMPAAGWAAKSGDPILFVDRNQIPGATYAALQAHARPHIYVLGPPSVISAGVERALRSIGTVTRIQGADPVANAIAFARYTNASGFGWGVVDPGHGLVFANDTRPLDAAAAAPLSASGTYGPLLLVSDPATLPLPVGQYLLDIQPGYQRDPVRGVYNHGWLIGDTSAISLPVQSRIDSLLEIAPVRVSP